MSCKVYGPKKQTRMKGADMDAEMVKCKHSKWNATGVQKVDADAKADTNQCKCSFSDRGAVWNIMLYYDVT